MCQSVDIAVPAEVLEGAEDPDSVKAYLGRTRARNSSRACDNGIEPTASRRVWANDAWNAAIASIWWVIVGHDSGGSRLAWYDLRGK